jgi:predicted alpha/beta hydrolase
VSDPRGAGVRVRIVAHRFDAREPRAAAVIGGALGVSQDFYFAFAQHLAARGITTFTFDFRGVGFSAPSSLRHFRASLTDWARHDYDAALVSARAVVPAGPLFVVGHSLGAQLPALTRSGAGIDAMVAVAGGGGYWGGLSPAARPFMLGMIAAVAPLAIPIAGYFPGRRLRMIGDLPGGVMRQWSRWARHPDYLVGVEPGAREAYARARFAILSLSISDDWMMPQRNIDSLHSHFRSAHRESRRLTPAQAGGPIGHMGFFRRRYSDALWPIASDWLLARTLPAVQRQRAFENETIGDIR